MSKEPDLNLPLRAEFERNISEAYFSTLDSSPSLSEEFMFHRMQMSAMMVQWVNTSPIYAHLDRKVREMFTQGNNALLSANPTDQAAIAEAQVLVLAATKLMSIISEAIEDGDAAKQEKATRNEHV